MLRYLSIALIVLFGARALTAQSPPPGLDSLYPDLEKLSIDIHEHPELSQHEEKTAAKLAERLRGLGFRVTDHFGGFGVVGILENGKGPTVMIRTELDALPVEEKTELPYASKVVTTDDTGATVHVAHACGHDIHMAAWAGTATLLAKSKDRWQGTLMMVAQPDEEKDSGARRMLADGLFTKFPKPVPPSSFIASRHGDTFVASATSVARAPPPSRARALSAGRGDRRDRALRT